MIKEMIKHYLSLSKEERRESLRDREEWLESLKGKGNSEETDFIDGTIDVGDLRKLLRKELKIIRAIQKEYKEN